MSELVQAVYSKPLLRPISCGFASVLNLNFGFPNFGEGLPLWWWDFVGIDSESVNELLQAVYTKPGVCYGFATSFSLNFGFLNIWGKGRSSGGGGGQ